MAIDNIFEILGVRYWFHGTDYKSAINIVSKGIYLAEGKRGGDFSDGLGFYLTSNFEFAKAWSKKMMRKETSAIIVFDTHCDTDLFSDYIGLELSSADQEWEEIIQYYRNGASEEKKNKKRLALERKRQYIYGPISYDGCSSNKPNWKPRARLRTKLHNQKLENEDISPYLMQLCIKDELLACDIYDKSKMFVIFFK